MKPFLGFWKQLPRPFFALAPMADVTDTVFRRVIARHGRPDVFWTEFVSCDGLCSPGREVVICDLQFSEQERPIVAQVFGAQPETVFQTAQLIQAMGFDGLDINMGCPEKNVVKQGSCSALINQPVLAQEIIRAAQAGAPQLPISVKTRLGFQKDTLETWLPILLEAQPAVITLHARTKKEMSDVPARWDRIGDAVTMAQGSGTLIIGNGDVCDLADARNKAAQTGADGVMLGRAVFGNPWLFDRAGHVPSVAEKLRAMVEHARLFEETWAGKKPFQIMKKHFQAYASGFLGAKALRVQLMACEDIRALEAQVEIFLKNQE